MEGHKCHLMVSVTEINIPCKSDNNTDINQIESEELVLYILQRIYV